MLRNMSKNKKRQYVLLAWSCFDFLKIIFYFLISKYANINQMAFSEIIFLYMLSIDMSKICEGVIFSRNAFSRTPIFKREPFDSCF